MSRSPSPEGIHERLVEFEGNTNHESRPRASRWKSTRRSVVQGLRSFVTNNTGLLLVMSSQAFFSVASVAVKQLSRTAALISVWELVTVRMGMIYVCSMAYMLGTGMEDPVFGPKGVRLLLVFRGASGFVGLSGLYFSLQYLSLSDATVLTFLSPLCTAVAGALFLHESFRLTQALAGIVSLIGVTLIARPPFIFGNGEMSKGTAAERVIAVGVSLIGVLGMTSAYTTIRAIGKRAHSMHSVAYFAMISVTLSVIGMIVTGTPFIIPSRLDELGLLLAIGVSSFAALHLLTMGLQREAAGRASMAVYTQIVFATIYQRVFFHMYPSWLSIIGTCLILSSALYVAMTKEKAVLENIEHGSIHLTHDDHDHLEAGLHGAHAKSSDSSSRQEQM